MSLSTRHIIPRCTQRSLTNLHRAASTPSLHYTQRHNKTRPWLSPLHTSHLALRHASSTATAKKTPQPNRKPTAGETIVQNFPRPQSSSSPSQRPSQPSSSAPKPPGELNPKLNPASSTYAPPLDVPSRAPSQGYAKYLWKTGKLYVSFYKQGVKNTWRTSALAKTYRQTQSLAIRDASRAAPTTGPPTTGPNNAALAALTRAEWQIVRRSRVDMLRLPAFALVLLVFGEWTPLIVMACTPLVPEPCRIPSQVERELKKLEKRRRDRMLKMSSEAMRLIDADRSAARRRLVDGGKRAGVGASTKDAAAIREWRALAPEAVARLDQFNLLGASTALDVHGRIWDYFLTPPAAVLRWGLERKLRYLQRDDRLIARDGGWKELGAQELQKACVDRGIEVVGKSDLDMRRSLGEWFAIRGRDA